MNFGLGWEKLTSLAVVSGKLDFTPVSWDFLGDTSGKELTCQSKRHRDWVWSLGWEDPLEEEMATHPSILAL